MVGDRKLEKTKLKLEALYKEYGTRTKEIELFSGRYHRNVGYVQTYLTALSSFATYIYLKEDETKFFQKALCGEHHFEIIVVLSFLTIFLFFLHASMMDSLYMLIANGSRVGVIEKEVNETIKTSAMEWENKVMPFILTDQWWVVNGALRPQPLIFAWMSLLFMLAIGSLCYFSYKYAESYFGIYAVLTILFSLFHLWQWVQLSLLSGGAFIKNSIFHIFGFEDLKQWDTDIVRYAIAPLTVFFGFGIFAMAALQTDSFIPFDEYPFGLLAIPSIWIGDFLILPFLNRRIYDTIKLFLHSTFFNKKQFIWVVIILSLVSFSIMGYLHNAWTKDAYTGFMDLELGSLSFAGKYHFIFSSVEFLFILILLYIGITAYRCKDFVIFKSFSKAWFLVLTFISISLIDFIFRHIVIFFTNIPKDVSWFNVEFIYAILNELIKQVYFDATSFIPFFTTLLIYKMTNRKLNKKELKLNDTNTL